jgi:hypothetical protein
MLKPASLTVVVCAIVLLGLLAPACASGGVRPYEQDPPLVRDIAALYERLDKAVAPQPFIKVQDLGEVVYGSFKAPVRLYSVFNRSGFKYKVFLSGGIHGNEPAGVETLALFIESLARDPALYGNVSFEIVPLINPWGWAHDVRFNRDGIDINRDLAPQRSQEARMMAGYLKQGRYDLMIDHHEDPSASGFYLYQYAMPSQELSRQAIAAVRAGGLPVEQDVSMVILRTDDGLIDAPMWGLWYMLATGQIGVPNYSRLYNSGNVYTIETATRLNYEDRLAAHREARQVILDGLVTE